MTHLSVESHFDTSTWKLEVPLQSLQSLITPPMIVICHFSFRQAALHLNIW